MSKNQYYTYIYLNPLKQGQYTYKNFISFLYEPFYVGKGKGSRWKDHLREQNSTNKHKSNTIDKIKKSNIEPIILKLISNVSNDQAIDLEKYLIQLIGRADLNNGTLTNMTDGGEGMSNRIPWNKGKKFSEEEKAKQYASRRRINENKKKASAKRWESEEERNKISDSLKIFFQTEEGIDTKEGMGKKASERQLGKIRGKNKNTKVYSEEEKILKYASRRGANHFRKKL